MNADLSDFSRMIEITVFLISDTVMMPDYLRTLQIYWKLRKKPIWIGAMAGYLSKTSTVLKSFIKILI